MEVCEVGLFWEASVDQDGADGHARIGESMSRAFVRAFSCPELHVATHQLDLLELELGLSQAVAARVDNGQDGADRGAMMNNSAAPPGQELESEPAPTQHRRGETGVWTVVRRLGQLALATLAIGLALSSSAVGEEYRARTLEEASLLAADAAQLKAGAAVDIVAVAALTHLNLRVTSPNNQVMTREDVLNGMRTGQIRNERFERSVETAAITGDLGVVMGREQVVPAAHTQGAAAYGERPLQRRFTNIYTREGGGWLLIARHASVMVDAATEPRGH
jgi:hypothetical protein